MEGINSQAMLSTLQIIQQIQYNDTHVYLYIFASIPRGLCQLLLIIMLFPFNYLVGLFITHQLPRGPIS